MMCKDCDGTGSIWEKCCNGMDCACRGMAQDVGDCSKCNGTGEVDDD